MIHRGVLSTMERFMAFLIENYAGNFPVWLAPVQAVVIPIADDGTWTTPNRSRRRAAPRGPACRGGRAEASA